jgi:hypothetical protein
MGQTLVASARGGYRMPHIAKGRYNTRVATNGGLPGHSYTYSPVQYRHIPRERYTSSTCDAKFLESLESRPNLKHPYKY